MKTLIFTLLVLYANLVWAKPDPNSAKADVKASRSSSSITIELQPDPETKLNYDGPWALTFSPNDGFSKKKFGKSDFDKKAQRFEIPTTTDPKVKLNFKLVYFLCSLDVSWCKRIVYKGNL